MANDQFRQAFVMTAAAAGSNTFAGAPIITVGDISDPTPTFNLTTEPSEPNLDWYGMRQTAWWKFVAYGTGTVKIDTELSSSLTDEMPDTVIVLYTGSTLTQLSAIDGDDDGGGPPGTSALYWSITNPGTYYIQVGCYDYSSSSVSDFYIRLRIEGDNNYVPADPATSVIKAEEITGAPPGVLSWVDAGIHLFSQDAPSTMGNGWMNGYGYSPITADPDGSITYSMERWFRFVFSPPLDRVQNLRFWMPGLTPALGWTLKWGTSLTYVQPTVMPSSIAVSDPPITLPLDPNILGVNPPLTGPGERFTEWIVLQASVDGDAPPGPMLGSFPSGGVIPLVYRLDWSEY